MDGHDDDKNVNGAGGSSTQGIFSTPELTVDAEKIAQDNTAAAAESSRAKIASIFANTETGKQAQRLNDAMIANTVPATEDIVLDNGPKKRRKWPIVLAVVVLLAVVGGAVGYFVVGGVPGQEEKETPLAAFNNYLEYLEKGPEEYQQEGQADQEWFAFAVSDNPSLDNADLATYLDTLQQKYNDFLQSLTNNGGELADTITQYGNYLSTMIKLLRVGITESDLLQVFAAESPRAAYQFIENQTPDLDENDHSLVSSSNNALNSYLSIQLKLLENYSSHGCMDGSYIDYTCTNELVGGNVELQELSEEQQQEYVLMEYNLPLLEDQIKADTEIIKSGLGA